MSIEPGANLALLLLGGFRQLAEAAEGELARRGFPGITAANELALGAIAGGAANASDLGRRLNVSKQAAAKTIAVLEGRGYVERAGDPADSRRKLLAVTARGQQAMREGRSIMDGLRRGWAAKIGDEELSRLESSLAALVGEQPIDLGAPGSLTGDTGD